MSPGNALPLSGNDAARRSSVVVVGPSSSLTIPGIIVSQIVQALVQTHPVTRIEVDLGTNYDAGIHRAPSLAVAHDGLGDTRIVSHRAPTNARLRAKAFHQWITPNVGAAVAFVWPGIENGWIRHFLLACHEAGTPAVVICASVPRAKQSKLVALAATMVDADLVLVGDELDAAALASAFGDTGPVIETHRALSMRGRSDESSIHRITAFLQRDNVESLSTLLAAFDAIPEAWIGNYRLQIAMRYSGSDVTEMVANSYHADSVELIDSDLTSRDLEQLCAKSSALIVADPAFDSRAFSIAVGCGVAIVVLGSAQLPDVGRGYVGALLADLRRPVSVHVALTHALRLAELQFPEPDAWNALAKRLLGEPPTDLRSYEELDHADRAG